MFFLKTSLFNPIDVVAFPLALLILFLIGKAITRRESPETQRYFKQAFWVRVVMLVGFTAVMQYYYGGGDSYRYYISILDMRKGLADGAISFWDFIMAEKSAPFSPLYNYFAIDELGENHYYMMSSSNYAVPKFGTFFSYPFFSSYLAVGMCFSFFALLGSLQMYRIFVAHFPKIKGQIALACFFIPTVCFWSSGILKDSITFGALGFLFSSAYNLLVKRRKIVSSLVMAGISYYLLYLIKPYIMLAFAPALLLLMFTLWSEKIASRQLKNFIFGLMVLVGLAGGFALYQNLTSEGALQRYNTEVILDAIDKQRSVYEGSVMQSRSGSNFALGTTNPALMFPLGIVASYFRPFPWEIQSPIMVLNALESLLCLALVLYTFFKVGFFKTMRIIFSNPFTLFSFVFAVLFGGAVGTSTGNFGSLVRYKIPGMPFFIILFLVVLYIAKVPLPAWTKKFKLLRTS